MMAGYVCPPSLQVNDWQDDWVSFYVQQRLQYQLGLLEQSYGDREARELWASLQVRKKKKKTTCMIFITVVRDDLCEHRVHFSQLKSPNMVNYIMATGCWICLNGAELNVHEVFNDLLLFLALHLGDGLLRSLKP